MPKDKTIEKAEKALGFEYVREMEAMDADALKKIVVDASEAMRAVKEELEKMPAYQTAKENIKDLSSGKREVDKRQKMRIQLALELLDGTEQEGSEE